MNTSRQSFRILQLLTMWPKQGAIALILLSFLMLSGPVQAIPRGDARIAVDAMTGEVLTAIRSKAQWYPASLTKMMTLYLLFDALERGKVTMDTRITLSRRAARQPPSKLGLGHGGSIRVRDVIPALAVKSANDVAVAVAEHLARSEAAFARQMTRTARRLGMHGTNFRNASGLHHSQQVTTARDMAILSVALIRDFPRYYSHFSQEQFRFGRRTYNNHNRMLGSYEGMDGLKTGFIYKAGYNLAASVKRDKRRVVAVVLGGDTSRERSKIMKNALDLAFERLAAPRRPYIDRPLPVRIQPPPPIPRPRPRWQSQSLVTASVLPSPGGPVPRVKPAGSEAVGSRVAGNLQPHSMPARANRLLSAPRLAHGVPRPRPVFAVIPPQPPGLTVAAGSGGEFGIQIGAFRSRSEASTRLATVIQRLPDRFGDVDPVVLQYSDADSGTFFRARLIGFDTRSAAANTCRWLLDRKTDCIIVASAD